MFNISIPCLIFFRKFRIRLKRDTSLFTDDFQLENPDFNFDRSKLVKGEVLGKD